MLHIFTCISDKVIFCFRCSLIWKVFIIMFLLPFVCCYFWLTDSLWSRMSCYLHGDIMTLLMFAGPADCRDETKSAHAFHLKRSIVTVVKFKVISFQGFLYVKIKLISFINQFIFSLGVFKALSPVQLHERSAIHINVAKGLRNAVTAVFCA